MEFFNKKKEFIYMAVDNKKEVVLGEKKEPIYSFPIKEGARVKWDIKEQGILEKNLKVNEKYRVELDLEKEKEEAIRLAYEELKEMIEPKKSEGEEKAKEIGQQGKLEEIKDWIQKRDIEQKQIDKGIQKIQDLICEGVTKLGEDLANTGDDLVEALLKEEKERREETKNDFEESRREIVKEIENAAWKNTESVMEITTQIKEIAGFLKNNQEQMIKKEKLVDKEIEAIKELSETTELIHSKVKNLDQLDQIRSILSEKGVEINREYPPVCEEEEDIINLVRYSKKISEQLGYAARELVRKKSAYERKEQSFIKEQEIIDKKIEDAYKMGIIEGRLDVVKAILEKYTNIDIIIESEIEYVHAIWSFLQELGVEIAGEGAYKKGKELVLSEEDAEKMAARYKKIEGAGRYRVEKTGLSFANEVVFLAEFKKIVEN